MSVYMNYPPTWRPMDFAMHYGIGVNRLNRRHEGIPGVIYRSLMTSYDPDEA